METPQNNPLSEPQAPSDVPAEKRRKFAVISAEESQRYTSAMREALEAGKLALESGDIPIGVLILNEENEVIASAYNRREKDEDPTAHAEVLALRQAAAARGRWNLTGCTLVVTAEPCVMCAGAIVMSRISTVVYGASSPKAGAAVSCFEMLDAPQLNHTCRLVGGVLEVECAQQLKEFFRGVRSEWRARGKQRR